MWSTRERPPGRVRIFAALAAACGGGFALALVVAAPGSSESGAISVPSLPLSVTVPTVPPLPTVTLPTVTLPTSTATGTTTPNGDPAPTTTAGQGTEASETTVGGRTPRCRLRGARPDARCTPGHAVRVALRTMCARGRRLAQPTAADRRAVLVDYGIAPSNAKRYRIDRLLSARLGGTNKRRNLWPIRMQRPGAREKQWLDARLVREVCNGRMSVAAARKAAARDWVAAYRKLHG